MTDRRSPEAEAYRALYRQARWRGPHGRRAQQLQKQPLCEMCLKAKRLTPATVADHVIPHRGDPDQFWQGELQSLCDAWPYRCHSKVKQSEERLGYSAEVGDDGWPLDPMAPCNRAR
jgi:5-methylcytosine-specific restriction protein A